MKNPKKLSVGFLFDDTLDSPDGVAQYVKTLGAWLSGQGHDVRYLVGETKMTEWAGAPVYSLSKNQTVRFNGNRLSVPRPARKKDIQDALARQKLDVLHVMVPYSPLMAKKVIQAAAPGTAVVGTFHIFPSGFLSRWGSAGLKIWLGRSLGRFDEVVSVSGAAAEFAWEAYGLKTEVIPNPVDIKRFSRAKTAVVPNKIVFLGRLVKRKGAAELIRAFSHLSKRVPSAELVIAGRGPQKDQLQSQARALGLADKITFAGFISEEDKPGLLAGAAVACFPSLYGESFGIVLIEAMAAGSGVVLAGDNPGYASVLGGQPVLLADPRDPLAFASRLELLLKDKKLAARLHDWQAEQLAQYDINTVGASIFKLYNGQIARRSKKSNNDAYG